jgi:hypothetical protein
MLSMRYLTEVEWEEEGLPDTSTLMDGGQMQVVSAGWKT